MIRSRRQQRQQHTRTHTHTSTTTETNPRVYQPTATQTIPQHRLKRFLLSVEPPIFAGGEREASTEVFKMNISSHVVGGVQVVHYVDTLVAVVRYLYVRQLGVSE